MQSQEIYVRSGSATPSPATQLRKARKPRPAQLLRHPLRASAKQGRDGRGGPRITQSSFAGARRTHALRQASTCGLGMILSSRPFEIHFAKSSACCLVIRQRFATFSTVCAKLSSETSHFATSGAASVPSRSYFSNTASKRFFISNMSSFFLATWFTALFSEVIASSNSSQRFSSLSTSSPPPPSFFRASASFKASWYSLSASCAWLRRCSAFALPSSISRHSVAASTALR
mmetsp:Transcript_81410/g.252887  ORF Transcript_81410/g.252887 Transcript_81410/m.252887 type:complete len:231 (+) Transcript_81410:1-693(+)